MAVLLTGATGFVGMEVLARFLERSDEEVLVLVRAADESAAEERLDQTLECVFGDDGAYRDRVSAVRGDIERPGLGLSAAQRDGLADRVTAVIHSAASISFTLPLPEARRVNVEGTRNVLELAELCERRGGIDYLSYISTAYVAGDHPGVFGEDRLDVDQTFRNSYERSKFEAERLVRARAGRLPVQVFRPSIVVGEAMTGWTASFNVLYVPVKAYARGMLPALPARRSAPVDAVPVDYVADAVFELSRPPDEDCPTYHLVAGRRATTVGRLIDLTVAGLGRREPIVIHPGLFRRVVHPLLCRFHATARKGLERTKVYFPYFAVEVTYDDERARRRLAPAGIEPPPIESYFDRLLDYGLAADWGRRPLTRAAAWQRIYGDGAGEGRPVRREPVLSGA